MLLVTDPMTRTRKGISYDPVNHSICIYRRGLGRRAARYDTIKGHGDLKTDVKYAIEKMLKVSRLESLSDDRAYLESVAKDGVARAQESLRARSTLYMFRLG